MFEVIPYSLLALGAVLVLSGAIFIMGRAMGAAGALEGASELRQRVTELEIAFASFAEQYEISNTRSAAKIGKLRRKIDRLEDGDDPDREDDPALPLPAPPPPGPPAFNSGSDVLKYGKAKGII